MSTAEQQMAIPPIWRALVNEINGGRIPDGEPGIRDVDAPCEVFQPFGEPNRVTETFGDCETDGHYICSECVHIKLSTLRERRGQCVDCGAPMVKSKGLAWWDANVCSEQCTPLLPRW